jgi:hypothetical protein
VISCLILDIFQSRTGMENKPALAGLGESGLDFPHAFVLMVEN